MKRQPTITHDELNAAMDEALAQSRGVAVMEVPPGYFLVDDYVKRHDMALQTAHSQLKRLTARGVLEKIMVVTRGSDGVTRKRAAYGLPKKPTR